MNPTNVRTALIGVGALLSAAAAVVHGLVAPVHYEHWAPFGALFFTAAGLQAAWAALAVVHPSENVFRAGVVVNAGIVAAWALSRTVGLPVGPEPWSPEPAASLDLFTTLAEVGVIAASSLALVRPEFATRGRWQAEAVVAPALLASALLVAGAVAFGGAQPAAAGDHGHAGASAAHHHVSATSAPTVASAPTAAPRLIDPRSGGLQIALGEWSLGVEAKAIRPGEVTFVVTNRGKVTHGFEIEAHREDDERGRGGDREKAETRKLAPGQSTRITMTLGVGRYKLECFVSHHDDLGMEAILDVRADAPLVAPPAPKTSNAVAIKNFAFSPATLRVKRGTTVRWQNADAAPHTVTGDAFDSGNMGRGARYSRRFLRAGTFAYLCAIHPQMRGRIVVR